MPQRKDKWSSFFADLGRPTKRGIRKCPKCGTVNGTRGNSCKNKACDVVFRDNGSSKKSTTEACKVVTSVAGFQIFSVRLRDRGPDYRNFVKVPVQSQGEAKEATQRCFSESQPLTVKQSVMGTLNIPSEQQQNLTSLLEEGEGELLVQRVSKTSFVVRTAVTSRHPLGYLHIMFFRHNRDDGSIDKKFLCTCKPFKTVQSQTRETESSTSQTNSQSQSQEGVAEMGPKFCIHYHACLCAFASDDTLSQEFDYFLSQVNQECAPALLSQLHLVTLPPPPNPGIQMAAMDANHISVEIMQENISLLESIATADDTTLHNVQSLEGVLSDQIIVTNVDDSLNFGEATGLESLEDGDSQVCQIFASTQNAIHLASSGYSNAENLHQTVNITGTILASPGATKKRKHGSGEGMIDVATLSTSHPIQPLVSINHYDNSGRGTMIHSKGGLNRGFQATTMITYTAPVTTTVCAGHPAQLHFQNQQHQTVKIEPAPSEPPSAEVEGFEMWLSGVNERLNSAMNYQFSGKPEPIIYYISMDYFEMLRERITSGVRKKRLPNQTVIISRTDRPPAGTFTKHVWKITNIFHVLQIFHNQIIPLKISQYFIKGTNGIYEEWTPPSDNDRRSQLIKPHVHSTYLKVGKNDPSVPENIPFTIEWIPDILPQSKLGELSIIFEFGRCGNSRDEFGRSKDIRATTH